MTRSGIKPVIFLLVVHCLKQLRHRMLLTFLRSVAKIAGSDVRFVIFVCLSL
jgi:hypothetical protein